MRRAICPKCSSDRVYASKIRGFVEAIHFALRFKRPFRCHHCYQRFLEHFWYQNWGRPEMQSEWRDR